MGHIGIDARLTSYRVGGISTYINALIDALGARETAHRFTVFKSRKASFNANSIHQEAHLWTPPHHRVERLALSMELMRFGLDIFHATDFIPPYFGAQRHVITIHDLTFLHYPQHKDRAAQRYYNDQIEYAVKKADHILAVSEATKSDLMLMLSVPEAKITVQPHGVGGRFQPLPEDIVQATCQRLSLPRNSILSVGTLEPRKNLPTLIDAYQKLPAHMREAHPLILVGKVGWLFDDTIAQIKALQAKGANIIVRNDIGNEDLPAVYNSAALFVLPSLYEGFGLPAIEAIACGIPIVASNNSSLPEVVGNTGLLFNAIDPDELSEKITFALTNPEWRQEASQKGIERAKQFTWERSAEIALSVYDRLSN